MDRSAIEYTLGSFATTETMNAHHAVLDRYEQIPFSQRSSDHLRRSLQTEQPALFERTPSVGGGTELLLPSIAAQHQKCDPDSVVADIERSLEQNTERIAAWQRRVETHFPPPHYKQSFRTKDRTSIKRNAHRAGHGGLFLDVVGMRLVPTHATNFLKTLRLTEELFADEITYKLNTLAYTNRELTTNISPESKHYRAVHYYLPLDHFFAEIQVRPPATDQWSDLHHQTVYKPRYRITTQEKEHITLFGEISNAVDYYDMIGNNR